MSSLNATGGEEAPSGPDALTFPHHPGELPRDVPFRDGCCGRLPVAGGGRLGWEAIHRRLLVLCPIGGFVQARPGGSVALGHRLLPLLGRGHGLERAVCFDGRDDYLLELLERVPQVPSFKDVLQRGQGKGAGKMP